ncbi:MAG: response regulator [Alphaproteobacteria bacterium]|nr:response regulator [Alphaproteobacteria bacterium]
MASLTNVVVAGGDAAAAVARVEMLSPAGYAGLAVSNGLDVQSYVTERQPDLVLFEGAFDDVDAFEVARGLKRHETTQHIPIIMLTADASPHLLDEGFAAGFDDMLDADAANEIILSRLQPLVRLSTMHAEFHRRIASAGKFGLSIDTEGVHDVDTKNCRVLFVGSDSGRAMALADALSTTEFSPVRETDHFKAGARVAEETFDAAVIAVDEGDDTDKALNLCAHIRNNPRLFNLPVLLATGNNQAELAEAAYGQGASIAVPSAPDVKMLAAGLRFLVRRQRLRWNLHGPITATLQPKTADGLDGLYSKEFLRAHLAHLLDLGVRRQRNLSLALFSIQNIAGLSGNPKDAKFLMQQAADWISGLVRVEDMAARLGEMEICVALPGAAEREAQQATDRIVGVLQNNQFKLSDGTPTGSQIWVQSGAVAAAQGETAEALIARARDNLA